MSDIARAIVEIVHNAADAVYREGLEEQAVELDTRMERAHLMVSPRAARKRLQQEMQAVMDRLARAERHYPDDAFRTATRREAADIGPAAGLRYVADQFLVLCDTENTLPRQYQFYERMAEVLREQPWIREARYLGPFGPREYWAVWRVMLVVPELMA